MKIWQIYDRPITPEEELVSTKKLKLNYTSSDAEKTSTLGDNTEGDLQMKDNSIESTINQEYNQNLIENKNDCEEPKKKSALRIKKRIIGQNGELKEEVDDDDPNDKTYNIEEAHEGKINENKSQIVNVPQEKEIQSDCLKGEVDKKELKDEIEELKQSEAIDKEANEKFKEIEQNETII